MENSEYVPYGPEWVKEMSKQPKYMLIQMLKDAFTKGIYDGKTKEQIEKQNEFDIKEMAHWYGGFDELLQEVERLKGLDEESNFERYYSTW